MGKGTVWVMLRILCFYFFTRSRDVHGFRTPMFFSSFFCLFGRRPASSSSSSSFVLVRRQYCAFSLACPLVLHGLEVAGQDSSLRVAFRVVTSALSGLFGTLLPGNTLSISPFFPHVAPPVRECETTWLWQALSLLLLLGTSG